MKIKHKAELMRALIDFGEGCDYRLSSIAIQFSTITSEREKKLLHQERTVGDFKISPKNFMTSLKRLTMLKLTAKEKSNDLRSYNLLHLRFQRRINTEVSG